MSIFEERLEFGSNSILLATDLSPASDAAMAYAVRFARRYNARITALQVFEYALAASPKTGGLPCGLQVMHSATEDAMQELLADFCKENVRSEVVLSDGNPTHEILDTIVEKNIDLALVGTHGREGADRLVWGSVADEVVRKASCPVVTTGPKVARPTQRDLRLRNLVYATDFSEQSLKAALYAVSLTNDFDACLHLLHILPTSMKACSESELMTDVLKQALKQLSVVQTKTCSNAKYELGFGDRAADGVLVYADAENADMIILGVHRAPWVTSHLSGITSHIIREAKCPVLTVSS